MRRCISIIFQNYRLPWWLSSKEFACKAGAPGDFWVVKIPQRKACNLLQYSGLENPTDIGAWRATVYGVTESDTTEVTQHACMLELYNQGLTSIPHDRIF